MARALMRSSCLTLPVFHGIQGAFVANCRYFRCVLVCGDSPLLPLVRGDHEFGLCHRHDFFAGKILQRSTELSAVACLL